MSCKWFIFAFLICTGLVLGGCANLKEVHQGTVMYQPPSFTCVPEDNGDVDWAKIPQATWGKEKRILEREKIVDPTGYIDEWCRAYQRVETEKYWGTSLGRTYYWWRH